MRDDGNQQGLVIYGEARAVVDKPPKRRQRTPAEPQLFGTIVTDCPWRYKNRGGRAKVPYETMSIEQLCALGVFVRRITEPDAFLFCWAPSALLLDGSAVQVVRSWGFTDKQVITWIKTDAAGKPRLGVGNWARNTTEHLILAIKGHPKPLARNVPTSFEGLRRAHSEKPDEGYALIEELAGGPYLEMFARRQWPGWVSFGDQAPA